MTLSVQRNSFDVKIPGKLFCWISGYTANYRPANWGAPWHLQVAHIASGQGRARRVDDRRAVIVLCPLVHDLHVSDSDRMPTKTISGICYPTIDERHTLWIKQKMDKEFYDEEFLAAIWIGNLPEPNRPPDRWMQELYKNQGIIL